MKGYAFASLIAVISIGGAKAQSIIATGLTASGTLGGHYSMGSGINSNGYVVGQGYLADESTMHAFLHSGGVTTDLGTLGGTNSYAYAINSTGQIVGIAENGSGVQRAFLYSGGTMTDLGTLGGTTSRAYGINASGQIVGTAFNASEQQRPFLYSGGVMTDLGSFGGSYGLAMGINSSGTIVGYSQNAAGYSRAFVYSGSSIQELGTLGGNESVAQRINDSGQIVGGSRNASSQNRPFIYEDGIMTDLGVLPGQTGAYANSINSHGVVVGDSFGETYRAFLHDGNQLYDLNYVAASLLSDGSTPGFTILLTAQDINDAGVVVGTGTYFDGVSSYSQAYSLTISSVPEPSSYATMGGITVLLLAFLRRSRHRRAE